MSETVKLSSKGQLTLPSKIRKELGLDTGSVMIVIKIGDEIIMKPIKKLSKSIGADKKILKGVDIEDALEKVRTEWEKDFDKKVIH